MTAIELLVLSILGAALGAGIGGVFGFFSGDIGATVLRGLLVGLGIGFVGPLVLVIGAVQRERMKSRTRKMRGNEKEPPNE